MTAARGEFWILERMLTEGYPVVEGDNGCSASDRAAAARGDLNRANDDGYTPLALAIRYVRTAAVTEKTSTTVSSMS